MFRRKKEMVKDEFSKSNTHHDKRLQRRGEGKERRKLRKRTWSV